MLNLDIWVFNKAKLTKEHLSYLAEHFKNFVPVTAKLYNMTGVEFLRKVEGGEIYIRDVFFKLAIDLVVAIFFNVFAAFFKGVENR